MLQVRGLALANACLLASLPHGRCADGHPVLPPASHSGAVSDVTHLRGNAREVLYTLGLLVAERHGKLRLCWDARKLK